MRLTRIWTFFWLIHDPDFSYPVILPGIKNRPRLVPAKNDHWSGGTNALFAVDIFVLSLFFTPNDRCVSGCRFQSSELLT